jgi:hypothetical protein
MFIPDPESDFFLSRIRIFPSQIRIKEFRYFNPQNMVSKLSEIWSALLFIPDPNPDCLSIPDPGGQKGTGSRIRNTASGCYRCQILGCTSCARPLSASQAVRDSRTTSCSGRPQNYSGRRHGPNIYKDTKP